MKIVSWMKNKESKQFKKFLTAHLFNEYSSYDILLANRVKTQKKSKKVLEVINMLAGDNSALVDYVAKGIKGHNPVDKYFIAKFLTRPRLSKRKGHKQMLNETRQVMKTRESFLKAVCDKVGFEYTQKETYIDFHGYYKWRKQYNGELESVLFSSKKVLEFAKTEFHDWLQKLPASARFRVRCRLLSDTNQPKGNKWGKLGQYFLEWEAAKSQAQAEQRVIEEKVRQGSATADDKVKLEQVKKEAKVTVGAVNFTGMMGEIITGSIDKVKVQPFLDKVNLPYNNLVFVDDSGSMNSSRGQKFTPFEFATFMATICLMKNPDDAGRGTVGFFSSSARLYGSLTSRMQTPNKIMRGRTQVTLEKLYDPEMHFLDNLKRFREFARSIQTSNGTSIGSIPDYLKASLAGQDAQEILQHFPVWTIISDGN
jgi:hypothetical protein